MPHLLTAGQWRRLSQRRFATAAILASLAAGCSQPREATRLATFDGGTIAVPQLEEAIQRLPEAQRRPPAGVAASEWLGSRVADLAIERALLAKARKEGLAERDDLRLRADFLAGQEVGRQYVQRRCASPEVSDEELRQLHAERGAAQEEPWILLRHIYKRHPPSASPEEKLAARAAAEEILAQLRSGASFIELARTESDSETAADGGLLGRVSRQAPLHPAVLEAAWALADGEMSAVVATDNGFHILLREESGTQAAIPFEDAAQDLRARQAQAQRLACAQEIVRQAAEETEVSVERQGSAFEPSLSARIGAEHYTMEQLAGLAGDPGAEIPAQALMTVTQNLVQAKLLVAAARRDDAETDERLRQATERQLERLLVDRQWRQELRRTAESAGEERLRQFFAEHTYLFHTDLELDLGVIVVAEPGLTRRATWERALEIVARARDGEPFEELARRYSTGPSAEEGGHLGWRSARELRAAFGSGLTGVATELEPGRISEPVELGAGPPAAYAVVRVTARREPQPRAFEEVRPRVVETMAGASARALASEARDRLLAEVHFRLDEAAVAAYLERLTGGA